jgi:hypothetical protein
MCRGSILLNGITQKRVTNEVLATSPDQANKRGLTTSGESASALGGSAAAYNARRPLVFCGTFRAFVRRVES